MKIKDAIVFMTIKGRARLVSKEEETFMMVVQNGKSAQEITCKIDPETPDKFRQRLRMNLSKIDGKAIIVHGCLAADGETVHIDDMTAIKADWIQAVVVGKNAKPPEVKVTSTGKEYTQFSIRMDIPGRKDAYWPRVKVWEALSEEEIAKLTEKMHSAYICHAKWSTWPTKGEELNESDFNFTPFLCAADLDYNPYEDEQEQEGTGSEMDDLTPIRDPDPDEHTF